MKFEIGDFIYNYENFMSRWIIIGLDEDRYQYVYREGGQKFYGYYRYLKQESTFVVSPNKDFHEL